MCRQAARQRRPATGTKGPGQFEENRGKGPRLRLKTCKVSTLGDSHRETNNKRADFSLVETSLIRTGPAHGAHTSTTGVYTIL